jgi:hypothetical protein
LAGRRAAVRVRFWPISGVRVEGLRWRLVEVERRRRGSRGSRRGWVRRAGVFVGFWCIWDVPA